MSNPNVVRTAAASILQTCQYLDIPLKTYPNFCLNQKLGIYPDEFPTTNERSAVRYLAIGNGGHEMVVGGNGRIRWKAVNHEPRHAALYNQLPFVLRPLTNDLSLTERAKYRLRRIETWGGVPHAAYYLRVLDKTGVEAGLEFRTVNNGVTTSTPYSPTLEDLNPVPPVLVAGQAVTTTGDYIASSAKINYTMTPEEVQEFINATTIIEGEAGYAVISEMAVVSGVDRSVTQTIGGQPQTYIESIYAQVTSFLATAFVMEYQTDGIAMTFDVGNVEPLLTTTIVP